MRARSFVSRGTAVLAAVAAVLVGLGGTSSAAAGSQVGAARLQVVHNVGSGNGCMDLNSYAAGTAVTLYRCNSTARSQWWDTPGDGTIRSYNTGYCMDISSYNAGAVVHMKPCHGGLSQTWYFRENLTVSPDGSRTLCMDLRSYNNGTPVTLHPCHNGVSQQWAVWADIS